MGTPINGCNDESHHDPVDTIKNIRGETKLSEEVPPCLEDPSWRGKKQRVDNPSVRENRPDDEKECKTAQGEDEVEALGDGLPRT